MRSSFILVLNGYSFFHQMDKVVIKLEFVVIMVNFVVIKCIFGVIHSDLVVIMVQNVVIVLKTNKKKFRKPGITDFLDFFLLNLIQK